MDIKNERLKVVSEKMNGGRINLYDTNYETLLMTVNLSEKSSSVNEGSLHLLDAPLEGEARESGIISLATITDKEGDEIVYGLTVGTSFSDIIIDKVEIERGQKIIIVSGIIVHG
jgi:hypothetical protein